MDDKNKKVIEVYNKIATAYAREFDEDAEQKFVGLFLKHIKEKRTVLDIGCGAGKFTAQFYKHGFNAQGLDLSSGMLKIARKKYPNIKFKKGDVRRLPYKKNSFDAIWAGYVLFHINRTDFDKALKSIKKVLKSDGVFGLAMQEGKGEVMLDEPLLPKEKIYLWLYTKKELREILSKAGFKIIAEGKRKPKSIKEFPFNKLVFITKVNKKRSGFTLSA